MKPQEKIKKKKVLVERTSYLSYLFFRVQQCRPESGE
jgi:hypothetical protein